MAGSTALGMLVAGASLVAMMIMEGSSPLAIILLPPLVLVLGATFGAAMAGCTPADVRRIAVVVPAWRSPPNRPDGRRR